ncbi:uncharacterized protein LY89DRAFT_762721 [Mollisia scopiformis]|uniref:Uncharacterized protein n=1 Tax=Mollisia scopiformis TaxID=149040 RepID=A0A194XR08_MOLSC|nr:uncharacterized protein LY89DRAFT_762721 [Mollisia scopiformis]KUJ22489.1 hypothetical protein LY89DRAFT_762721 [Mollisia scopiformis]
MIPAVPFRLSAVSSLISLCLAIPIISRKESKPIYYLSNCFLSTNISTQDAEIDYHISAPKSFPASKPKLISVLNPTESIDYEDSTVMTLPGSPFNLTVVIGDDAYTAKAGTVVGSATGSSVKGTLKCKRLTRIIVYESGETECYADYACS